MRDITISIGGQIGSGKSTIAYIIKSVFEEAGVKVNINDEAISSWKYQNAMIDQESKDLMKSLPVVNFEEYNINILIENGTEPQQTISELA